jgi:predicted DCC family thiol-disulfide oxidoreductase YuxK
VVDRQGRRHHGAGAIRYLTRRLRRLWWLAPLLHIPFSLPLWQWLYGWVARHRYWFGGRNEPCEDGTCAVHRR